MDTERLRGRGHYLKFPLRMRSEGAEQCTRVEHIREQIIAVLLTIPGERVFRREFGIGASAMVFAPMNNALISRAESELKAGISEALFGEVRADSLLVSIGRKPGTDNTLEIAIRYHLAAINQSDELYVEMREGDLQPMIRGGNRGG